MGRVAAAQRSRGGASLGLMIGTEIVDPASVPECALGAAVRRSCV